MDDPVTSPTVAALGPPTASTHGRLGRWPFGIIAVTVLRLINAVTLIAVGLDIGGWQIGGVPIIGNSTPLTQAIDLVLAALVLIGIVGLLLFQRWGWVLTMVLVGLSLMGDLIRLGIGQPDYLGLLLHVLAAFYLNGRSVRALASQQLDHDPRRQP